MKKLMMTVGAVMMTAAVAAGSFAYQGVLRDEVGGRLKDATATITFRLYDGPDDSATVLWDKDMTLSIDTNGLFNAELTGAGKTVGTGIDEVISAAQQGSGTPLYVGLTVKDSSGEIRPRQKIISTPLALFASDVKEARGDFIVNGDATVKGNLAMGDGSHLTIVQAEVSGSLTANGGLTVAQGATQLMGGATVDNGLTANTLMVQKEATVSNLVASGTVLTPAGVEIGVPEGCILMWSGAEDSVPNGWAICDGQNGTPDLRDRFVVGAGSEYAKGATGGEKEHKLTADEMPKHKHKFTLKAWDIDKGWKEQDNLYSPNGGAPYSHTIETDEKGGDVAHENRPPYYALYYIMKLRTK